MRDEGWRMKDEGGGVEIEGLRFKKVVTTDDAIRRFGAN
jgi:hypothetical protein